MKLMSEFIQEKYSPLFDRNHNKLVSSILKSIEKAIKKNEISKEDALEMLNDVIETLRTEY